MRIFLTRTPRQRPPRCSGRSLWSFAGERGRPRARTRAARGCGDRREDAPAVRGERGGGVDRGAPEPSYGRWGMDRGRA